MTRFVFSEHPELARHFLLSRPLVLNNRTVVGIVYYCSPGCSPRYRYRFRKLFFDGKEGAYQYFLSEDDMEFLERLYPEVFL